MDPADKNVSDPAAGDANKDSAAPAPSAEETGPEISEKNVPKVGTEVQASNPEGRNNCV